jgi:hypothetical protein
MNYHSALMLKKYYTARTEAAGFIASKQTREKGKAIPATGRGRP